MVLGTILFMSCESRSGKLHREKQAASLNKDNSINQLSSAETATFHTWNVMRKNSVFIFEDKQNLIIPMRQAGIKEVILYKTTNYKQDTVSQEYNFEHESAWYIPDRDNLKDTIIFLDLKTEKLMIEVETLKFPIEAFKLRY